MDITQDVVEESEDERYEEQADINSSTVELPPAEMGRLEEISDIVVSCMTSAGKRDKLALLVESENYIPKLLKLLNTCEDVEDVVGLHHLYTVFKNFFLLNRNALNEVMFSGMYTAPCVLPILFYVCHSRCLVLFSFVCLADEFIFDVIGCLEYDPAFQEPRRHRQFLKRQTNFHEVIAIQK